MDITLALASGEKYNSTLKPFPQAKARGYSIFQIHRIVIIIEKEK
ncbi:MAG TPA: hypothetical protein PKY56_01410 [Candidatus Kapabacteria bacterium]|nr:hypothetical protein [Candidatus Kapabacteria bacterium]